MPDTDVDTPLIRTRSFFLLSSLCILQSDTELKGADFVSACIGTVSVCIGVEVSCPRYTVIHVDTDTIQTRYMPRYKYGKTYPDRYIGKTPQDPSEALCAGTTARPTHGLSIWAAVKCGRLARSAGGPRTIRTCNRRSSVCSLALVCTVVLSGFKRSDASSTVDSISRLDIRTGEPHRTRTVPRPKATWYRPQEDPLACYTSHGRTVTATTKRSMREHLL